MKRKREENADDDEIIQNAGRTKLGEELVRNKQFPLNVRNAYDPEDDRVTMNEKFHWYYIDGIHLDVMVSATGFIHQYFHEFKADQIIQGMIRKGRTTDSTDIYFGMNPTSIKAKWEYENGLASAAGTTLHARIERYYGANSLVESVDESLGLSWQYFLKFDDEVMKKRNWTIYRTEWMIFIEELLLTGSVDGIVQVDPINYPKRIIVLDWKHSKKIDREGFKGQKGKGICSDLQDCNYNHYNNQLSLYRYILENHYGFEVVESYMVIFHENNRSYELIKVVDLRKSHIEKMIEERRIKVEAWKLLQQDPATRTNQILDLQHFGIL